MRTPLLPRQLSRAVAQPESRPEKHRDAERDNHITGALRKAFAEQRVTRSAAPRARSRLLAAVGRGIQGRLFFAESEHYGI